MTADAPLRREPSEGAGDAAFRRNERWLLLLLLPLCYAFFFHQLCARDIWDPDEDEYVLVNREMVLDGHWL